MKKLALLFLLSFLLLEESTAQGLAFDKGSLVFSAGYGFPNSVKRLADAFNDYSDIRTSGIGPLHGKIEYGVSEKVGVGLSVNFVSSTFKFNDNAAAYNYSTNRTSVKFNFRVNYHFSPSEKFDPYVGVGFGYGDSRWKTESNDPDYNFDYSNPIPIGFETTLGARLFVTPRIGFYAEAGVAKSFVQFGLCFNVGSTGGGGDFRF